MKTTTKTKFVLNSLLFLIVLFITSCATPIELTSSWKNKQAQPKSSPLIMVMVKGPNLANRKSVEGYLVSKLKKNGFNAIPSLDILSPDVQKYDSTTMVSLLRQNKVDMLLTNMIVKINKNETYIPAEQKSVPVGGYATPYSPYYGGYVGFGYNSYYGYYSSYSYEPIYDSKVIPGQTIVDVEVIIESKLFDVSKPELVWFGQSKSITKEPSKELFQKFANIVVGDIMKSKVLVK
jgi:hypothetical protein